MSFETPAGRLHAVLAVASGQRQGVPAINTWAGILNASGASPEFFARVAKLCDLVVEVRALVASLPESEEPDFLLEEYEQIERTMANFANVASLNMVQFMDPLKDTGLLRVQMADRALRRSGYREPTLESQRVDELRDEVHDLISDVLDADGLTQDEKRSIVAHLRAVEETLTNSLLGSNDVRRATHGLIGVLLSLPRRATENAVIRHVAEFAATVTTAVAVSLATNAAEVAIDPPKPTSLLIIERIANGHNLPAITSGSGHGGVVDAEIMQDDNVKASVPSGTGGEGGP